MAGDRTHSPDSEVDVIVVGGGIVGAATALAIARRDRAVILIERSGPEAAHGSSRGGARILCPAPLPDAAYLELGLLALDGWRAIERDSATRLLELDGAISVGSYAEAGHAALTAAGVPAELITARRARERFGVELPADKTLLHQPEAGVIRAHEAHQAILALAREAGAVVCHDTAVDAVAEVDGRVEVAAGERRWRAGVAVLAAGPSNRELAARLGIAATLEPTDQTVAYFDLPDPGPRPIVVMDFDGDEPYALWEPGRGLKAALHAVGSRADSESLPPADPSAVARIAEWVGAVYPDIDPAPSAVETCKYTRAPDERFVLERHGPFVLASACSGQGFQFAPATAERVAELALAPAEVKA